MAQTLITAPERLQELVGRLEAHRGFAEVLASLQAGHASTLGGVWGSSCALVAASLTRHAPGPLVVVYPHIDDLDDFGDDLALFSPARPQRFPAWERETDDELVYDEIYGERLRLLKQLAGPEPPPLVVTSIQSLLQPVPSREKLAAADAPPGARRRARHPRAARLAGRQRVSKHQRRRAAGRVLAPRRHPRHFRARLVRPGANRVFRRRGRIDPPFRGGQPAQPGNARGDRRHAAGGPRRRPRALVRLPARQFVVLPGRAGRHRGGGTPLSRTSPAPAGRAQRQLDHAPDHPVRLGDGRGRAGRLAGDDLSPGHRVGRALQRRDRQGTRRTRPDDDLRLRRLGRVRRRPDRGREPAVARNLRAHAAGRGRPAALPDRPPQGWVPHGGRPRGPGQRQRAVSAGRRQSSDPPPAGPGDRQLSRAARRRLRRPPVPRHRPLPRLATVGKRPAGRRAPGPRISRRHENLRARLENRAGAEVRRRQQAQPAAAGAHRRPHVGPAERSRPRRRHRPGRRHARAASGPRPAARHPLFGRHALAARVRRFVSLRRNARPVDLDRRHQDRHGAAAAHGPAVVRRRRLRQDRAGDAGRLQGGRQRPPGCRARAHHDPGRTAPAHLPRADGRVPDHRGRLVAVLHAQGNPRYPRRAGHRLDRHRHRHPSPRTARRAIPEPGPGDHRRRAALRRGGEGAAQGAAPDGRRANDDRHADSPHAALVAIGRARHLEPGNAAQRSPGDRNPGHAIRRRAGAPRDPPRTEPRRPDLLRPQPRPRHRESRPAAGRDRARGADRHRPRPDERGGAGAA